jgi:hypothetical protein
MVLRPAGQHSIFHAPTLSLINHECGIEIFRALTFIITADYLHYPRNPPCLVRCTSQKTYTMSHTIEPTEIDTKKTDSSHIETVATEDLDLKTGDPLVSDFPEGGYRAWMAVAGAFLCLFVGGVVCLP